MNEELLPMNEQAALGSQSDRCRFLREVVAAEFGGRFIQRVARAMTVSKRFPIVLAAFCLMSILSEAQAGLMLPCELSADQQTVSDGVGAQRVVNQSDQHDNRRHDHRYSAAQHNTLPRGAGAPRGSSSTGLSTVAVLDQPIAACSAPRHIGILEDRGLFLPDSPVFDRLRPPRLM
jgi:hypothetical protein